MADGLQVDTLGTHKDTEALRDRLAASRDAVQTLAREASAGLKELHAQAQSTPVSHPIPHDGVHPLRGTLRVTAGLQDILRGFPLALCSTHNEEPVGQTTPWGGGSSRF